MANTHPPANPFLPAPVDQGWNLATGQHDAAPLPAKRYKIRKEKSDTPPAHHPHNPHTHSPLGHSYDSAPTLLLQGGEPYLDYSEHFYYEVYHAGGSTSKPPMMDHGALFRFVGNLGWPWWLNYWVRDPLLPDPDVASGGLIRGMRCVLMQEETYFGFS